LFLRIGMRRDTYRWRWWPHLWSDDDTILRIVAALGTLRIFDTCPIVPCFKPCKDRIALSLNSSIPIWPSTIGFLFDQLIYYGIEVATTPLPNKARRPCAVYLYP